MADQRITQAIIDALEDLQITSNTLNEDLETLLRTKFKGDKPPLCPLEDATLLERLHFLTTCLQRETLIDRKAAQEITMTTKDMSEEQKEVVRTCQNYLQADYERRRQHMRQRFGVLKETFDNSEDVVLTDNAPVDTHIDLSVEISQFLQPSTTTSSQHALRQDAPSTASIDRGGRITQNENRNSMPEFSAAPRQAGGGGGRGSSGGKRKPQQQGRNKQGKQGDQKGSLTGQNEGTKGSKQVEQNSSVKKAEKEAELSKNPSKDEKKRGKLQAPSGRGNVADGGMLKSQQQQNRNKQQKKGAQKGSSVGQKQDTQGSNKGEKGPESEKPEIKPPEPSRDWSKAELKEEGKEQTITLEGKDKMADGSKRKPQQQRRKKQNTKTGQNNPSTENTQNLKEYGKRQETGEVEVKPPENAFNTDSSGQSKRQQGGRRNSQQQNRKKGGNGDKGDLKEAPSGQKQPPKSSRVGEKAGAPMEVAPKSAADSSSNSTTTVSSGQGQKSNNRNRRRKKPAPK